MQGTARDIMDPAPVVVSPDTKVPELARKLLERHAIGAVVLAEGKLVGVVTTMDLVFREKNVHLPTFFTFMDAIIPLESMARTNAEVAKITATTVGELMTRDVQTVGPDTSITDLATRMVDEHLSLVPVLSEGAVHGVVTRDTIVQAVLEHHAQQD